MNKKKLVTLLGSLLFLLLLGGCSKGNAADEKVTIYTNADEEPVEVIKNVLDQNGYKGKYNLQSFGTSELGGKLLAEGKNIEADLVTMSTFYLTSAQKKENMFKKLELPIDFVEPTEGTYTLTESLAVIDKGEKTNPEAEKMLNLILEKGRKDLLKIYPSALYKGETVDSAQVAKNQKVFPDELTAELLEKHQKLVD